MTALLAVAACADKGVEVSKAPAPDPSLLRDDCYTVVLFDGFEVKPAPAGTPPEHAALLGEWRFGAWDGEWCHDMIVTEITKDGRVYLMDLHAPYEPWGKIASAFKRTARITDEGTLTFRHGKTQRQYRLVGRQLHGMMEDATEGMREVRLRRPGEEPVPAASADAQATSG